MRNVLLFARKVLHHWAALVTGGVLIGAIGIYQGTGHYVAPKLYWTIAIAAVAIAIYRAWLEQRNRVEFLEAEALQQAKSALQVSGSNRNNSSASLTQTVGPTTVTASPSIDASQRVELHQHFSPMPTAAANAPPPRAPSVQPNVKYISRKVAKLTPVDGPAEYFIESSEATSDALTMKAFVANFRNERIAGVKVPDWETVRAQIIYRGKYEAEVTSIGTASWLGTFREYTHFDGGSIRSVVIAIQRGDGSWVAVSPEETATGRPNMVVRELKTIGLTPDICQADVILHDSRGYSLEPKRFQLDLSLGLFAEA